jgi:ATP-binding cassette subfamily B multidrug efflux pump
MIKKLVSHLGEYKRAAVLTPLFAALEAVMDVLLPTIMAFIIDQGIEKGDMNAILKYGLLTFLVAVVALALGVLAGKYAAEASTGFAGNLRDAMYENIQHYSFSNIDKFSTAGLVTRMTTDVTNVQNAFQMIERMCVRAPVHLVFALFMAVMIGGPLSLIFVVAVVFLVAVLAGIMVPTFHIFDRVFKNYDALNASVQENVSAIRVVKSFVREGFENEKYTKACQSLYDQFVNAESRLSFNNPAMLTAVYGCNIALSWLGAKYVLHGAITTGQLNALFGYIMNILMALMMLSMAFVMISMSAASAKRIVEVLDETTDLPPAKQPVQQVKDGGIEFEHVTFKYKHGSGQPVLNDITFRIKPGETLGIIGGTGSAKSSLVQLIPRLYDAETGTVKVGGVDVRDYNLDVLRREVSMVLQKNVLFSGTILDNLRWGDENASEEECIRVAKLACADEFIERFPDKYNTWIEQGGSNVSGGQKQRLSIARAIAKDPKIYLFDDSFSALDFKTDVALRRALKAQTDNATVIIVAQRISTVLHANQILVLDEGRLVGKGTHAQLMASCSEYQEIARSQLSQKELDLESLNTEKEGE